MSVQEEPNVGERVRALRERRGLSLRALAQRCSLSINAISRIERGEASPTVSSLHQLAMALGVPIVDLFDEGDENTTVLVRRERRLRTHADGILMESLGSGLRHQQIEPFVITLEGEGSGMTEAVVHPGQEWVFCLEGVVDYTVGGQTYRLVEGDSLLFEATQPHRFENGERKRAVFAVIFEASEGTHLARRRHLEGNGLVGEED